MRTLVIGFLLSTAAWAQTALPLLASAEAPADISSVPMVSVAPMIKPVPAVEKTAPIKKHASARQWLLLSTAAHSAAGFDAWSTRRNINSGSVELNPLLKPFANSNSIYPVMQIGPTMMDLVAWKMMSSNHRVLRKLWWVPQAASSAISFSCGIKNATQF
jgi:hypothetical protein